MPAASFEVPDQSFFLFGPRGTGKSTWIRHVLPDALYVDLLRPEVHRELSARPEREQEVKLEGWARDVGTFARFLEAVSFSHGSVLDVANVARGANMGPSPVQEP